MDPIASSTTNYLYDGADLLTELDQSGSVLAAYAQEPRVDGPIAMERSTSVSYYEQDGLNSISSLSNSAASLTRTYPYDSFGNLSGSSGSVTNPFQYASREFDPETKIYLYRARYYDPSVGRFFSEDPIKFAGGPDFYVYVRNSPTSLIDPFGMDALGGDVQALLNIFPGSTYNTATNTMAIPLSCDDVHRTLEAQGYQYANSWGYWGPGSPFFNPKDHNGGWEWRTFGPGFHFRMVYSNLFKPCTWHSCTLDQFHIDSHNPLEPGQMWPHIKCDFLHLCSS